MLHGGWWLRREDHFEEEKKVEISTMWGSLMTAFSGGWRKWNFRAKKKGHISKEVENLSRDSLKWILVGCKSKHYLLPPTTIGYVCTAIASMLELIHHYPPKRKSLDKRNWQLQQESKQMISLNSLQHCHFLLRKSNGAVLSLLLFFFYCSFLNYYFFQNQIIIIYLKFNCELLERIYE